MRLKMVALILMFGLSTVSSAGPGRNATESQQHRGFSGDRGDYSIKVRPVRDDGQISEHVRIRLWQAEARTFGSDADPTRGSCLLWDDNQQNVRWVSLRSLNSRYQPRLFKDGCYRLEGLPAGRYRVSVVSDRGAERRRDPTPYGLSEVIQLGGDTDVAQAEVPIGGNAALTIRVIDAQSQQAIDGLALRLRDSEGMPIIQNGGNHQSYTSQEGEVHYGHLRPGPYSVEVIGKRAKANQFLQYEPLADWARVDVTSDEPARIEITVAARPLVEQEIEVGFPISIYGRVMNHRGQPLEGITVLAERDMISFHSGIGRARTNAEGDYRLYIRPSHRPVLVDYAQISVDKEGWHERSFNQQGNLVMTSFPPESITFRLYQHRGKWRRTPLERIVFPRVPKEINFVLAPQVVLEGRFASGISDGDRIYLTGDGLPRGTDELDCVKPGKGGTFRFKEVPVGDAWKIGVRRANSPCGIETKPFTLNELGVHHCEVKLDSEGSEAENLTFELIPAAK